MEFRPTISADMVSSNNRTLKRKMVDIIYDLQELAEQGKEWIRDRIRHIFSSGGILG